jgi:hypothetical protein
LLVGNETIVASAGDVVIMNPYEFHATIKCSEEKGKYHLIMVGLDFFPTLTDGSTNLHSLFFSQKKAFGLDFYIIVCRDFRGGNFCRAFK